MRRTLRSLDTAFSLDRKKQPSAVFARATFETQTLSSDDWGFQHKQVTRIGVAIAAIIN
jgi:hypothetical protein